METEAVTLKISDVIALVKKNEPDADTSMTSGIFAKLRRSR